MEFKIGDKVRVINMNNAPKAYGDMTNKMGVIKWNSPSEWGNNKKYGIAFEDVKNRSSANGYFYFSNDNLELIYNNIPTLLEIKEKKLTCVIHTPSKEDAICVVGKIPSSLHSTTGNEWLGYWDKYKENTCYNIIDGRIDSYGSKTYFEESIEQGSNYLIYEFSDLFATGGVVGTRVLSDIFTAWEQSHYSSKFMEKAIQKYDEVCRLKFKNGSSIEVLPNTSDIIQNTSDFCTGFRGGNTPKPVKIEVIKDRTKTVKDWVDSLSDAWAKLGCTSFIMSPDEIKKMEEKKMPTKFTFYVTEGTRVDKSCNKTVPTMTTFVSIGRYHSGKATCDKANYDERQGCLEAIANAFLDGNFDREFNRAVKANELADKKKRTCAYCGKVFDTIEECEAEEAWHIERRKARHERYLLRKRAKEIAFEEQAQKMAKEIMGEQK